MHADKTELALLTRDCEGVDTELAFLTDDREGADTGVGFSEP
jgi:hypothetical protein